MRNLHLFSAVLLLLLSACKKEETPDFKLGKNRFTIQIDGDEREYYVHVPSGYTGKTAVPVVFMLHGTGGNGEEFYDNSGWKEVGERENVITVFPSSWRYCITTMGETKTITKWNSQPAEWEFCDGQTPRDDIKFFNLIIEELTDKFKVDSKRFYLVGFSNGGQMAAKCSIEMSDKLAAIVESASSFYLNTTYTPRRKMPITFQIGNEDYGPGNEGPAIPLSALDTLLTDPNISLQHGKHYDIAQTHINSFGLNPNYTITGDTNTVAIATYVSATPNPNNYFQLALIKDLKHAYPNGTNHPLMAAEINWSWLKQHSLP